MQKLLTRYKTARAELNTPPNSVAQIMECDEARMQLIRALGAPYDISHDTLVERAVRRISATDTIPRQYVPAAPRTVPQLLTMYETALMRNPRNPRELEQLRQSIARILGSLDDADNVINEMIFPAKIPQPVGNGIDDDQAVIQALIDSKGPAVILPIDDYSDMKPLYVSPWAWAVAIVAFIIIWSLAIYGGYRLVTECIL